jgi:hypothetical protein
VDLTFLCGVIAVLIAILVSSVELLTKYRSRNFWEIFGSWYFLGFAVWNAFFCSLVYLALPFIEVGLKLELNSKPVSLGEQPYIRALVAGLGYLVIARSSILDFKTSTGEPLGVGFDYIYNKVAKYLLNFHEKKLQKEILRDFFVVFREDQANAPIVFLSAVNLLIGQATTADEEKLLKDALVHAEGSRSPATEYCFYLYNLIRDHATNAKDATERLNQQRAILQNDANRSAELRRQLNWLFPDAGNPS